MANTRRRTMGNLKIVAALSVIAHAVAAAAVLWRSDR